MQSQRRPVPDRVASVACFVEYIIAEVHHPNRFSIPALTGASLTPSLRTAAIGHPAFVVLNAKEAPRGAPLAFDRYGRLQA